MAGIAATVVPVAVQRIELLRLQDACARYDNAKQPVITPGKPVIPATWAAFAAAVSPPGLASHGTIFLHERRRPDGTRRLVALDARWRGDSWGALNFVYHIVSIGSATRPPAEITIGAIQINGLDTTCRVIPARPDPTDETHFTFTVLCAQRDCGSDSKTRAMDIDGWLRDDDTVLLEPRHEE